MTAEDYTVQGCTALIDTIGGAIRHIGTIHKYARLEDVSVHNMFIITIDGHENVSRYYSGGEVKKMIKHQKERYGWEFLFIGANIDAVQTVVNLGISRNCTMRTDTCITGNWSQRIEDDYNSRE